MNLLENNKKNNEKTHAQKIILILLIISSILCVIIGIAMVLVSMQPGTSAYSLSINDSDMNLSELQLLTNENGKKYISLKSICNQFGYNYYNGEFKVAEEDKTKGYIDNNINIIQFFSNSNNIYKTNENADTDYEFYKLDNNIITNQDNLYIAIEDLDVALNLILSYSEKANKTSILTPDYWITKYENTFKEKGITINNLPDNMKALAYGYVVISKDNKYGVININGQEIIGNKYTSLKFIEYTGQFMASNTNNQFGIISQNGQANINLQYDSIEILNFNPLLYKVKKFQKYGVMKADGSIVNDIAFDSIGYPKNKEREINYTLIIPTLNENIPESIVVCSGNKYGLMNLENGKMILDCSLNGIYSAMKDEIIYYIVETNDSKAFLENYINDLNRVTVNLQ